MLNFLNSPYPSLDFQRSRSLLKSALIGAFVAIFLMVFKPFGSAEAKIANLNLFLAGYGVVIASITFLPHLLFRLAAPRVFREEEWTIGRQIGYLFCVVSLGITASYWYLLQAGGQANWPDYLYFFRNALIVASFPILIITLLDDIRKLRHYESGAAVANAQLGPSSGSALPPLAPAAAPLVVPFTLTDDQNRPELTIIPEKLWCLHSEGNYVEAWTINDAGGHDRTLIRNTLASLIKQLPATGFLTCHRSWVVNASLVASVTGNAQGYQLLRPGAPTVVVARGRSKVVLGKLQKEVEK
ncbi:MAG: hypothetical protein ACI81P_001735 [Neolewinella sp.]